MESAQQIKRLIDEYLLQYSYEFERTNAITKFVNDFDGGNLISRKNFTGHITASAYVLNYSGEAIALLKHKFLNRWLQPGGHIDSTDDSILGAAFRELEEEMGIRQHHVKMLSRSIFDIDSHIIPENKSKVEPQHYHHDISFIFQCTNPQDIVLNESESVEAKWVNLSDIDKTIMETSLLEKVLFYCFKR